MANKLMFENQGVNVADYPSDLPEDSSRPAAEEVANLPKFEMPEDTRFMQIGGGYHPARPTKNFSK